MTKPAGISQAASTAPSVDTAAPTRERRTLSQRQQQGIQLQFPLIDDDVIKLILDRWYDLTGGVYNAPPRASVDLQQALRTMALANRQFPDAHLTIADLEAYLTSVSVRHAVWALCPPEETSAGRAQLGDLSAIAQRDPENNLKYVEPILSRLPQLTAAAQDELKAAASD